jgi:hypothetical protein
MRLAVHELETRGTVKNELAPLQTDKRHRSPNQGHDRENNRSDPDGEDDVVLGKEPGRTLLKRTRFARGGRLVSHGELPFFKTFGEVRDMYALSNFLTSFVVKMARRLPSGLSPRRAIYRVLRAGRASPCAWARDLELRNRETSESTGPSECRCASRPGPGLAIAYSCGCAWARSQIGRRPRSAIWRRTMTGPDWSERRRHASGWRKKARC